MVFNRKKPVRYMRANVKMQRLACRRCGSTEWGSRQNTDDTYTRCCHGVNCRLQWHETADYQHFALDGRLMPSRTAFERIVYTSHPTAPIVGQMVPTPDDEGPKAA